VAIIAHSNMACCPCQYSVSFMQLATHCLLAMKSKSLKTKIVGSNKNAESGSQQGNLPNKVSYFAKTALAAFIFRKRFLNVFGAKIRP